ncbi:MAG: phosphomannomutase/phosphoglucomutase [Xanthomonadaceae bacterium]|nr:phosphomannomutase/phosphoglucomutase [Xanthomonadaceae bacterium]
MLLSLALLGALLLVIAAAFHLLQRELARRSLATLQALDVAPSRRPAARPVPARVRPASGKAVESKPKQQKPAQAQARQPEPARPASERIAVNPRILRAYDVRGVVGQGLDAKVVYGFGRAIASLAAAAGQQQIVVARDGRLTSPELQQALIEGLVAGGRHVIDIGQTPTPMMHFATFHLGTSAGVMVTGSHNPPEYNGLKIVIDGRTLAGDEIKALGRRVEQGDFVSGEGTVRTESVLEAYVERICDDVTVHRPLRIVVDCGNGVAGAVAPQVYRALGCEVEELFCEVDGNFPHHHPDPTVPSNLDALISLVRLQGADLGLAFDGDGDRLGVVDNRGRILWPDRQLMLFSRDVLTRAPGGHVVFDVKCTARLPEFITDHAGVPVMWKSGHSMIRNKMRELQASLGGDMSGHIFFADRWYGFDDAIYAGARLLEILSMDARSSAEQFDELPNALGTAEIRIRLADGEAERIMQQLGSELGATLSGARVTTIDGLRVDLADGWALVRSSNTEPCLVLRFEGDDQDALARIQEAFRSRLLEIKPDLELPF